MVVVVVAVVVVVGCFGDCGIAPARYCPLPSLRGPHALLSGASPRSHDLSGTRLGEHDAEITVRGYFRPKHPFCLRAFRTAILQQQQPAHASLRRAEARRHFGSQPPLGTSGIRSFFLSGSQLGHHLKNSVLGGLRRVLGQCPNFLGVARYAHVAPFLRSPRYSGGGLLGPASVLDKVVRSHRCRNYGCWGSGVLSRGLVTKPGAGATRRTGIQELAC